MDDPSDWSLRQGHRLQQIGILLFILALLVGLGVPKFAVPRLGLSAHLLGVLQGIFLIVRYAVAETPGYACDVADRFLPGDIWLLCRVAGKSVRGNMGSRKLNATDRRWTSSREQASRGSNRNCLKECCGGADRRSDSNFLGASDVSGRKIRE